MSRDRPDVVEIIKTVDEFMAQIVDRLDSQGRYDALCARYLLGIAERELKQGDRMDAVELQRIESFLGEAGSLNELTCKLAASIRAGDFDTRWDEVSGLVLDHVIHKVAVSRPEQLDDSHPVALTKIAGSQ